MWTVERWLLRIGFAFLAIGNSATLFAAAPSNDTARDAALRILDKTGVSGGLVVHVGCGDGRLTARLRIDDRYLVHGLDGDARNVVAAREHVRSLGAYGPVSIDRFGNRLPYADSSVNLLIVSHGISVPDDQVQRALCPGGVAVTLAPGLEIADLSRRPWPNDIDQWTHFLHDASNNAVAQDTVVGPPRRLKWVGGPLWSRSHEFHSSLSSMVSAGGRLFYIFDEGLTSITDAPIPERWALIARDAFNGVPLWKREMTAWGAEPWGSRALRNVPPSVPRLLVAEGDRLFVTLAYGGPVSILDASTGETVTTCQATDGAEELRCLDGVLLTRTVKNKLVALDVSTGETLWEHAGRIQPLAWAAKDGRVFYQSDKSVICLDLATGDPVWEIANSPPAMMLVVHENRVLLGGRRAIRALAADSGRSLWTSEGGLQRQELFVAQGRFWYWQGAGIVGRDLDTGQKVMRLDTDDVFTPGHHLRCYQTKATEQFLITPNRGVEFVSLGDQPNTQCDWTRGACRYGIMPCNGLLYVPPNPCFCYPGVKLPGFLAFSGQPSPDDEDAAAEEGHRLEEGAAYGGSGLKDLSASGNDSSAWPTYRHDGRRSGATASEVAAEVAELWQTRLGGSLTPPVVCGDRVLLAAKDEHTVYALDAQDGRPLWHYTAGGRIDSPPTVYAGVVLFGCADGCVYCLRATDGELVWCFRAAPRDERIVAYGQLESPWRVHGSVLIEDGVAYFTAGRSTYLDGGIRLVAVDPMTGGVLHQAHLDTWARTREDAEGKPFVPAYHMEGAQSDILVSQGDYLYLGQMKFDRKLAQQPVPYRLADPDDKTVAMDLSHQPFAAADMDPKGGYERRQREWIEKTQKDLVANLRADFGSYNLGDRDLGLHVFSTSGFLDDSWFNRTYWMYSATWPGFYLAHRASKTGQLLVVGPERTHAVQAFPTRNFQSPLFTPGDQGYLLFADDNDNEPILDHRTRGTTKGWGFTRAEPPLWHDWVPIRIRSMVLAGEHLFVAGPPDIVDSDDPTAAFDGRRGALLRSYAADKGTVLVERKLAAPPVFDGLIAASGRLYMSTTDGRVLCLGSVEE